MTAIIDFYAQQSAAYLSVDDQQRAIQEQGLRDLKKFNFPTRKVEAWRYTSLAAFLQQPFTPEKLKKQTIPNHFPEGVQVLPLMKSQPLWRDYLGQTTQSTHAFHALNTLFLHDGWFIYVPENLVLKQPIELIYTAERAKSATMLRHIIVAAPGSDFTVKESYYGGSECYFTNTITEVYLKPGAKVRHYKNQQEGPAAFHFGQLSVSQQAHSQFESHTIQIGGQWVRNDVMVYLLENNAACLLNGIYVLDNKQKLDQQIRVHHQHAECSSSQDYKGILKDQSSVVFNGQIIVDEGANKTEAHQQNKNLLLSSEAQVNTKPQLNIYADDVMCSHGATVGQLDEEALFYLMTRGIEAPEAQRYLIQAFLDDNMKKMTEQTLFPELNQKLGQWDKVQDER
jgi:Fe-S cluster assembly protein SufD